MGGLRAGGFPVHRTIRREGDEQQRAQRETTASIPERYQDLAAAIHRTAITPRDKTTFLWGCICGKAAIVREPGQRYAELAAMQHVLDKASELYEKLEGKPIAANGEQTE